jgi:hypothetical protein
MVVACSQSPRDPRPHLPAKAAYRLLSLRTTYPSSMPCSRVAGTLSKAWACRPESDVTLFFDSDTLTITLTMVMLAKPLRDTSDVLRDWKRLYDSATVTLGSEADSVRAEDDGDRIMAYWNRRDTLRHIRWAATFGIFRDSSRVAYGGILIRCDSTTADSPVCNRVH